MATHSPLMGPAAVAHGSRCPGARVPLPWLMLSLPHLCSVVLLYQAETLVALHPFLFPPVPLPLPAIHIVRHGMRYLNLAALRGAIMPISVLFLFLP